MLAGKDLEKTHSTSNENRYHHHSHLTQSHRQKEFQNKFNAVRQFVALYS